MLSDYQDMLIEKPGSKKILVLVPFLRQQRGNAITAQRLYQGLTARGWPLEMVSLEDEGCWEKLAQGLTARHYALIHGFNASYLAQIVQRIPEILQLPFLLTTTGTDIHYGLRGGEQTLILDTMGRTRRIILFNQGFRELITALRPELEEKLLIIPQGIWLPPAESWPRSRLGWPDNDLVFILPSGLRPVKNLELALDGLALARRKKPGIRLLIIGACLDQEYSRSILKRVEALSWAEYRGEISHDQIGSWYQNADIVVNSSRAEGQPQAALEAMSLGKPALLSAVPGNLGIIEPGQEGFLFSTPEELAGYALCLADDERLRSRMGRAAAELCRKNYTLQRELDSYGALYRRFLQEG